MVYQIVEIGITLSDLQGHSSTVIHTAVQQLTR